MMVLSLFSYELVKPTELPDLSLKETALVTDALSKGAVKENFTTGDKLIP